MNTTRVDAGTELLWKQTSDRMADLLWKQYDLRYPNKLVDCDYVYRLRVAHALLLRFFHVYFNRAHKHPTIASQVWLICKVFNENNPDHWPLVDLLSG